MQGRGVINFFAILHLFPSVACIPGVGKDSAASCVPFFRTEIFTQLLGRRKPVLGSGHSVWMMAVDAGSTVIATIEETSR